MGYNVSSNANIELKVLKHDSFYLNFLFLHCSNIDVKRYLLNLMKLFSFFRELLAKNTFKRVKNYQNIY